MKALTLTVLAALTLMTSVSFASVNFHPDDVLPCGKKRIKQNQLRSETKSIFMAARTGTTGSSQSDAVNTGL